jgi:LysR family transcriptional regulator, nitrogen assimilation regulatory protein
MNFDQLKYFLRAAESGSLTKTASVLSTTQPIVSRSLAQLERELGGRLFHRTGHGVQLTPLGEALLGRAKNIIQGVDALVEGARSFSNTPSGEVRVGMLPSFSTAVVPSLFEQARHKLPDVKVKVFVGSTSRLDDLLDEGRIDIALNFGDGKSLGDAHLIGSFDTYLVGKKGSFLEQLDTIDFNELNNLPLILPATKSSLRRFVDELAEELDIILTPIIEVDTSTLYLRLVREGLGYAITTLHALPQDDLESTLVAVRIVKPRVCRKIMVGTSLRNAPSLATRRLTALIAEVSKPLLHAAGTPRSSI